MEKTNCILWDVTITGTNQQPFSIFSYVFSKRTSRALRPHWTLEICWTHQLYVTPRWDHLDRLVWWPGSWSLIASQLHFKTTEVPHSLYKDLLFKHSLTDRTSKRTDERGDRLVLGYRSFTDSPSFSHDNWLSISESGEVKNKIKSDLLGVRTAASSHDVQPMFMLHDFFVVCRRPTSHVALPTKSINPNKNCCQPLRKPVWSECTGARAHAQAAGRLSINWHAHTKTLEWRFHTSPAAAAHPGIPLGHGDVPARWLTPVFD